MHIYRMHSSTDERSNMSETSFHGIPRLREHAYITWDISTQDYLLCEGYEQIWLILFYVIDLLTRFFYSNA